MARIDLRHNCDTDAPVECDNCAWMGKASETKIIHDPEQRLDPGGVVPVGECPVCGALAYLREEHVRG